MTEPGSNAPGLTQDGDLSGRGSVAEVLRIGDRSYDIATRALLMAVLNRTPDSFYDKGATFAFDAFLRRADQVVAEGADILDVGGVKAGPGPEVSLSEELDRVVPAVEALKLRFDLPISVDTWNAEVARHSYAAGASMGNDISGFADPDYLEAAASAGAAVVATHIRLAPRVADPDPRYRDLIGEVTAQLLDRAGRAEQAGIARESVVLDAGLDLGKTYPQSLELLRRSGHLASLGYPLLLSASNKGFLGDRLGLAIDQRRDASLAAAAIGVVLGCRVLRVHDVEGTRRVRDALDAVLSARGAWKARVDIGAGAIR
jgi:dihydropteroate synthase